MASAARGPRWALIGVEALIGANAIYGGVGLIRDGTGMPADWLNATPFNSWVLPGVFLLVAIAVPMFTAAVAELLRLRWAFFASGLAGPGPAGLDRGSGRVTSSCSRCCSRLGWSSAGWRSGPIGANPCCRSDHPQWTLRTVCAADVGRPREEQDPSPARLAGETLVPEPV